ncbi:MAG: LutC/YkgG family protein [Dissulfurispiraceae bacterium]
MFEQFKIRAEAVSAEVHHFQTKTETLAFILQFLQQQGIADTPQSYAVWADCAFLKGLDKKQLSDRFPGLKFEVSRESAAGARIGITQMDWALANTGTLVQNSTAVEQRLASSLTFIHIALIATDKLLSDLSALLTKIDPREIGYIAMITGPSRTADIERVLTIGVHGPERLIIIFVDELGGIN